MYRAIKGDMYHIGPWNYATPWVRCCVRASLYRGLDCRTPSGVYEPVSRYGQYVCLTRVVCVLYRQCVSHTGSVCITWAVYVCLTRVVCVSHRQCVSHMGSVSHGLCVCLTQAVCVSHGLCVCVCLTRVLCVSHG